MMWDETQKCTFFVGFLLTWAANGKAEGRCALLSLREVDFSLYDDMRFM